MPELENEAQKEVIKEAISEWLDKQFSTLGKWTLGGAMSAGIDARADMALLQSALDYEADNTIQASAETLALVALRNPVEVDHGA